jgi:uncharacterized membrane protein
MTRAYKTSTIPLRFPAKGKERVFEIDFLRGFDIVLMILCHFMYDLAAIRDFFNPPASGPSSYVEGLIHFGWTLFSTIEWGYLYVLEFFFAGLFMFISGISCAFSHSNLDRSLKLAILSVLMSIVLEVGDHFMPGFNVHIWCGILQAMAIAMLIYSLVDFLSKDYRTDFALAIFFILLLGWTILKVNGALIVPDPTMPKYNIQYHASDSLADRWQILFGLKSYGDDYFPPIMTLALFFLGATVGKTLYKDKKSVLPSYLPKKWAKPILWVGSHTLEIYILHQPVLYVLLYLLVAPAGYSIKM